jgi:transcriptional regulator with XRE-family HTH domain
MDEILNPMTEDETEAMHVPDLVDPEIDTAEIPLAETDLDVPMEIDSDETDCEGEQQTILKRRRPFSLTRKEQSEIVRTLGSRFRQARELCNLSLSTAALRLGYKNPSKLSKVELATDTNSVPLWLIRRAARLYEVSIDYLFGDLEDWEIGAQKTQERAISLWLHDTIANMRERDMQALNTLHNELKRISGPVSKVASDVDRINAAFARFSELNPEFVDMRAGSPLLAAILRTTEDIGDLRAVMRLFHMDHYGTAKKIGFPQMDLF